jgi:RIO kinase 1
MTDQLDVLLADGVIDEVLGRLKSGKEANISLVRRGDQVLAAKVYKDRATRSFKNNADYKEGRKVRNSRTARAMEGGGKFGRDAAEQEWKSAEADTLYKLAGSGVRIPAPVMFYEGVLLMELVRDAEGRPAPRMIDVTIEPAAAVGVYADLVAQIIAMLCCDVIHGDLSPYNILASADGPAIIDFPQVVSAVHSSRAEFFFLRDFDNVVRFVSGFDPSLAVHRHDGRAIWRAYVSRELTPQYVPPPPPPPQQRGAGNRSRGPRFDARYEPRRDERPPGPRDSSPPGGARGPAPDRRGNGPPQAQRPQGNQGPPRWSGDRQGGRPPGDRPSGPPSPQGNQGPPRWSNDRPQGGRPPGDRSPGPSQGNPNQPRWSNDRPQGGRPPGDRSPGPSQGNPNQPRWSNDRPQGDPNRSRSSNDRPSSAQPPAPPAPVYRERTPAPRPPPPRTASAPPPSGGHRRRPKRHW